MLETKYIDSELIKKNMQHFHRNQAEFSAKTGKKGRKLKKNHSVEACKCFAPFVKLHWWDCPEVNKPCPIHGNILYQNMKPEKVEPDQNVTISFHPSSRTEKLFEPVKSLLAQCDPETKINFQYFSQKSFTDKENLKHQIIQTNFEDLKKSASNNIFVEKTKSSFNEKTNKMKKLKECFHSPCNSIAQKYPSPPPVRRNFNEISHEETVRSWQNFLSGDVNYGKSSELFSSNLFGLKKLERLPVDKRDSDFVTVTQRDKDNVISHKIFEIDHRKGANENLMAGFGKQQTQFAYSSFNIDYPNESKKNFGDNNNEENKEPKEKKEQMNSEGSQMSVSSAESVYVTPFLLMPPGVELCDNESFEENFEGGKRNVGVQVNEGNTEEKPRLITRYVQISAFESSDSASEQRMNTVSLQTDPLIYKKFGFVECHCSSEETISEKFSFNEKVVQTNIRDNTRIDTSTVKGATKVRTTEVQTSNRYQIKEVLITRYNKPTKEAANQVQNSALQLEDSGSSTMNKSLKINPSFANKETQISNPSESDRFTDSSKYRQLEDEDSKERIDRMDDMRIQKYDSDSVFFERKQNRKPENAVIQASSSRSTERSQPNARALNEEKISDLSELKRMIYEFFERATCNCREKEYEIEKKNRLNAATMTESPKSYDKVPKKEQLVSKEIQTTEPALKDKAIEAVPIQMDGVLKQYRQSVLLDDVNEMKTNYVCSFCGRNINKFSTNASTNTDDRFSVKEKTTIIETDYTEITKVKKTADPKDPSKNFVTTSTKQTIRPSTYYKTDTEKVTKTVQAQISPIRSNTPVVVSMKNENQKQPLSSRDLQERSRQSSTRNFRAKPKPQIERQVTVPLRECHCNVQGMSDLPEVFISLQDNKYSQKLCTSSYRINKPDDDNSESKYREDPKDKKESSKKQNRQFYHVTVNPSWPKDLINAWKYQGAAEESLKQNKKTGFEKNKQSTDSFSVKTFDENEESQEEISESKKNDFPDLEKCRKPQATKKDNFGFVRMPSSSVSQISMNKGSHFQSKVIKSEESVKTLIQPFDCASMKFFTEDANDLFTVKSCHLNPTSVTYNDQACDKLFACSFCKSLMFLKSNNNKSDDILYVPGPNDALQNQNVPSESEEKIPADEVSDRQNYEEFSSPHENVEGEEEYIEKYTNFSDLTTRMLENDFFKEGNSDPDSN